VNGVTDVGVSIVADAVTAGADDVALDEGAAAARLLRELCHDLIEPVAAIKLLVQVACMEAPPDPPVRDRLRLIADEAGRIGDICGQVLDQPRRVEMIRLDVLAAEAVASAQLRHGGLIEAVLDPVTLDVHPAVIIRILNNLLTNACRAAGAGGRVRLQVALEDGQARLAVSDSGGGLGTGKPGRASLGLEIIGGLALGCGGIVQMGTSDLGGLCVTVLLPCLPQPELTAGQRGRGRAGSPGPGLRDGGLPR
jgi:signal transduction histidine kinase